MTKFLVGLVIALLAANLFLAYRVVDMGISSTYRGASCDGLETANSQLKRLLAPFFMGKTVSEVRAAAKDIFLDDDIFERANSAGANGSALIVGGLTFSFDANGHVNKVE